MLTTTVWKNTVLRANSNTLGIDIDIAVSLLLRNAVKQRNRETKAKMLETSQVPFQSSVFPMSVPFSPEVLHLILSLAQRYLGNPQSKLNSRNFFRGRQFIPQLPPFHPTTIAGCCQRSFLLWDVMCRENFITDRFLTGTIHQQTKWKRCQFLHAASLVSIPPFPLLL